MGFHGFARPPAGRNWAIPFPIRTCVLESNSGSPQQTHLYMPSSWLSQYLPLKARSVPCSRVTRYCSGVSFWRHSASDLAASAGLGFFNVLLSMSIILRFRRMNMGTASHHYTTRFREGKGGQKIVDLIVWTANLAGRQDPAERLTAFNYLK